MFLDRIYRIDWIIDGMYQHNIKKVFFRRRRIEVFQFLQGTEKGPKNPKNLVNPV